MAPRWLKQNSFHAKRFSNFDELLFLRDKKEKHRLFLPAPWCVCDSWVLCTASLHSAMEKQLRYTLLKSEINLSEAN